MIPLSLLPLEVQRLFVYLYSLLYMKKLYIVRHAKSSWAESDLSDYERPLNERGKRDAPRMGKRLKEKDFQPDLVLSSPAKRALSTARKICKAIDYNKDDIKTDKRLYHADEETILSVIHELKQKFNTVMLVGHNPGLTDFVNALSSNRLDIDNIPTCGVAAFSFPGDQWKDVAWGEGEFLFFDFPKSRDD